jgi:hypothetical protein
MLDLFRTAVSTEIQTKTDAMDTYPKLDGEKKECVTLGD